MNNNLQFSGITHKACCQKYFNNKKVLVCGHPQGFLPLPCPQVFPLFVKVLYGRPHMTPNKSLKMR